MREYATARQVHSTLGRLLKPWFLSNGWSKRKGSSCAFYRAGSQGSDGYWCFWVQVSQWGNSDFGNEFTVNLVPQRSADEQLSGSEHARVLCTLTESDRDLGLTTETEIIGRKPKPPPNRKIYEWIQANDVHAEGHRRAWASAFAPDPNRWQPDFDVWLRYFAVDDIQLWGSYLVQRLGSLTVQAGRFSGHEASDK